LINFSKSNKFQKTFITILAGFKSDKSELKDLKEVFKLFDKKEDGVITLDELQ
jgi:Ca2+-binding EF-hand superfamily protein